MSQLETKNELLNSWVENFYNDLYKWAKYKTSDAHLAEDLVQEVFLIAANSIDKFKNQSSPKTWLFQILNHKLMDQYRAKSNQKIYSLGNNELYQATDALFDKNSNWTATAQSLFWTSSKELDLEIEQYLSSCMYSLPELWKKVAVEKYFENRNTDEICSSNQLSKANYWQIMHRMKLFLKDCIEKMLKINQ